MPVITIFKNEKNKYCLITNDFIKKEKCFSNKEFIYKIAKSMTHFNKNYKIIDNIKE